MSIITCKMYKLNYNLYNQKTTKKWLQNSNQCTRKLKVTTYTWGVLCFWTDKITYKCYLKKANKSKL